MKWHAGGVKGVSKKSSSVFGKFARWSSHATGTPAAFFLALSVVLVWCVTGPLFHFSDTWQLVINTGTTIVTFLMVFLIQQAQNRDTAAMQVKLDEIIRSLEGAHNAVLDLEELEEAELIRIRENYQKLATEAREAVRRGEADTSCPDIGLAAPEKAGKKKRRGS
ncbi:MAG: low affinity iron permease family protein [Phycisphaerales bacterium]